MNKPKVWVERFFVGEKFASVYAKSNKYVVPARHLAWYESPLDAARGVMKDQLGKSLPARRFRLNGVQSYVSGDVSDSANPAHWDICFVYEVKLTAGEAKILRAPDWFKDFGFKQRFRLTKEDFTRGHGDVLEEAGIING